MYPEDRVLVGVMPNPDDLFYAREQHWYRVPVKHAPQGIHAEYIAFYFTKKYPPNLRWGIYFYARRTGHEMVRRIDLLPDQSKHPRAKEPYYKLQLGPLKSKEPPIDFKLAAMCFFTKEGNFCSNCETSTFLVKRR